MSKMENTKEHNIWMKQLIAEEIEKYLKEKVAEEVRKYLKNKEVKERAKMKKMTAGFQPQIKWVNGE